MGLPPFYGNISATIIGYLVSLFIKETFRSNFRVAPTNKLINTVL